MLTPTKPVKSCECGGSCGGCCCCTKESIGLGNVDNTSDLNKPLSTDMVNALSGKVDLNIFTQLKNRVLALENSMGDIGGLENRMDDAELNIETLERNYTYLSGVISSLTVTVDNLSTRVTGVNDDLVTVGTRVDALEAKDSNNVKLSGVNVQTIQGTLKANDPSSGATDKTLVTANWVSQTGNSSPNNLIHKTGNETKTGLFICPEVRPRTFYSTKHVIQTSDATSGTYFKIYTTTLNSSTDRCALIMWNNTRKGLPSQCGECGFISIGARPSSVQIVNIAGNVPTNHFAITRKAISETETSVSFWATGQIKVYDIMFESVGYNNIDVWNVGDLSSETDFSSYDEVKFL